MDDLTRAFYELNFKVAFMGSTAGAFQDFFSSVMEKRYPGEFIRVRPWGNVGDRKNDGYLKSRRILFQCYAPNELEAAKCVAKINEDFTGALPYWQAHFGEWVFLHNSMLGLGPDVTKTLLDLGQAHAPLIVTAWGFEELRREVMALAEPELASLLGPAPTRAGMITMGLDILAPVLEQIALLPASTEPDLRPVPPDKLQRNMLSSAAETLLTAGMSRADLVRKYFTLRPTIQDQIAESFRVRYTELRVHSPDVILSELQRFAGGDGVRSPGVQAAVLAVLAFFFEECDIFERPAAVPEDA